MKNIIIAILSLWLVIAILSLWLVTGAIYHFMVVNELQSDLEVQKHLNKACEAERMWMEIQLKEVSQ